MMVPLYMIYINIAITSLSEVAMISLQVSDIKDCMTKLLSGDVFDRFYLVEADIRMGITYYLDGHLNPDFFDSDTAAALTRHYCLWKEARPFVFQIIRGKRQPLGFKIILAVPPKTVLRFLQESGCSLREEDIEGIYVNFLFEPGKLLITTGISSRIFSPDRSLEHYADDYIKRYLISNGIG